MAFPYANTTVSFYAVHDDDARTRAIVTLNNSIQQDLMELRDRGGTMTKSVAQQAKTTLETSGEDVKIHSKRVGKM
jgi:hypothetical protein